MAATRAQKAANRAVRVRDCVSAVTTPPPASEQSVQSRSERPRDAAFLDDSVRFMAFSPRVEFSAKLGAAVVVKASALLASVRQTSLHMPELLSVGRAWSTMDDSYCKGQLRAAPTLDLVITVRLAHDDALDTVVWPTLEEEQEKHRRSKNRRGDRWPQLWGKWRTEGRRKRPFQGVWLVVLLQLDFFLEHRRLRGDRGDGATVRDSFLGGRCILRRATEQSFCDW